MVLIAYLYRERSESEGNVLQRHVCLGNYWGPLCLCCFVLLCKTRRWRKNIDQDGIENNGETCISTDLIINEKELGDAIVSHLIQDWEILGPVIPRESDASEVKGQHSWVDQPIDSHTNRIGDRTREASRWLHYLSKRKQSSATKTRPMAKSNYRRDSAFSTDEAGQNQRKHRSNTRFPLSRA